MLNTEDFKAKYLLFVLIKYLIQFWQSSNHLNKKHEYNFKSTKQLGPYTESEENCLRDYGI